MIDPQCIEVERAVLAVLMDGRHKTAWVDCADLSCDHFTNRNHRLAWVGIMRLGARGGDVDAMSLANELAGIPLTDALDALKAKTTRQAIDIATRAGLDLAESCLAVVGGYNFVTDLAAVFAPASSLKANVALLRNYYAQRKAGEVLNHYAAEVGTPGARDRVSDIAGQALAALQALASGGEACNMGQALHSAIAGAKRLAAARGAGQTIPTSWGLSSLDKLCPLRPGRTYVLAAGSGSGKTSLALQAAQATSEGHSRAQVAIAALEMPASDLASIMAGRALGLPPTAILEASPQLMESDWFDIHQMADKWTAENTSHVRELQLGKSNSVDAVLAWFRQRHQATGGLALAIIDYLQLLEPVNQHWTEYQSLAYATRAIKVASTTMQIPIVLLAQLNRKGTSAMRDKSGAVTAAPEPTLSDLKGSSSIENDADAVILIYRTDMNAHGATIPMRIVIAKNRRGPLAQIDVLFRGAHQLFEDIVPRATEDRMGSAPTDSEDLFNRTTPKAPHAP